MVGRNMTEEQRRRKREKDKGKRGKTERRRGGKHNFGAHDQQVRLFKSSSLSRRQR